MPERRNWSESEVCHAIALYLVTDFGKIDKRNSDIIELAARIGRTPSAVALKLGNLAAIDTSIPQRGMVNASATDRRVWAEFLTDPASVLDVYRQQPKFERLPEIEIAAAAMETQTQSPMLAEDAVKYLHQEGRERRVESTQRIGQDFFRKMILTSYRSRCALTGIEDRRLLNASHIVAWKDDPQNRLNPSNGICLNALHDRAFDRHLITFDEDYRMKIADHVPQVARRELERVDSGRLELPTRFLPGQSFLESHRLEFFEKARTISI
ncbi:MAG: HNH endonuclease [Proteobacteria bacterium]|nr:HNH endonuclease [Pseudomonadota bacterium]